MRQPSNEGAVQQHQSLAGIDTQLADGTLVATLATFRKDVSLYTAKYKQKEIRVLGQVFRVLKKLCTVSEELRVLLHDHKIDLVSSEYVEKAVSECDSSEGNRLCVFIGHYLGFLANIVTMPPAGSKLPYEVLVMLLNQEQLLHYITNAHCENNPDSDYERNSLNSVIHVPLMVLLYNSTCNSGEQRAILTSHKNGMPLVRFVFESICRHREENNGKPDIEDPENEQVLEWF